MRFLARAAFLLFLLLGVLIAVSNRQRVELGLWPLVETVSMPLFLLVPALLLLGVLIGLLLGWLGGGETRRNARALRRETERLRLDAETLREELARERRAHDAVVTADGQRPSSEQRTFERQAALVDPESVVAARRIGQGRG